MVTSKDWREPSAASDQNSHAKYWVTLSVLGLGILIALGIAYIVTRTPPAPEAFLIYVDVDAGGQQRQIPFQAEDREALNAAFNVGGRYLRKTINDPANFEPTEIADDLQIEKKDTVFVYVSAMGRVIAGESVVQSSELGVPVHLEEFMKIFQGLKAENKILILDCGHDFADLSAYFAANNTEANTDFNPFIEQLSETLGNLTGSDVWIIATSGLGEVPLYSVNRRRTLFNEAFTTECQSEHQTVWDFYQSLCENCKLHGGQASQKPLLFRGGQGLVTSGSEARLGSNQSLAKISPSAPPEKAESEAEISEPDVHPITEAYLTQISERFMSLRDQTLKDYRTAGNRWPGDIDLQGWSAANLRIAEQVARVKNTQSPKQVSIPMGVGDAAEFKSIQDRLQISTDKANPSSETAAERQKIFDAFRTWQEIRYRAKYYVAMFDALSWLMTAEQLNEYQQDTAELLQFIIKQQDQFSVEEIQLEEGGGVGERYQTIAEKLRKLDDQLRKSNSSIRVTRNQIEGLSGATREMVYLSLLASPLFEAAIPEKENEIPRLWGFTREEILQGLGTTKTTQSAAISGEQRLKMSKERQGLNQDLIRILGAKLPANSELDQRVLDSWAYHLPIGEAELGKLQAINEPVQSSTAALTGFNNSEVITVSTSGQEIDLGFKQNGPWQNAAVSFTFSVPPGSGFELSDPKQPENWRHQIQLTNTASFNVRATKELSESEVSDNFSINCEAIGSNAKLEFDEEFEILLRLPRKNEIQVEANLDQNGWNRIARSKDTLLKSLPNRSATLEFRIRNIWHRKQPIKISLYGCLGTARQLPGEISQTTRDKTQRSVENGTLKPLFSSAPISLPAFDTNGQDQGGWVPVVFTANPELKPEDIPKLKQGFVLVIADVDAEGKVIGNSGKRYYWIENFPESETFVSLEPETIYDEEIESWEVQLKNFGFSKESTTNAELGWSFSDEFSTDPFPAGEQLRTNRRSIDKFKGINDEPVRIAGNIDTLPDDLLFFIDVDGWPRKQAYICSMAEFKRPKTADLNKVDVVPSVVSKSDDAVEIKIEELRSQENSVKQYGVKSDPEKCELDLLFKFYQTDTSWFQKFGEPRDSENGRPFFQINVGGEAEQFFYPRDVWCELGENPNVPGALLFELRVSDYVERRNTTGTTFEVDSAIFNSGSTRDQTRGLANVQINPVQVIFDRSQPEKLRSKDFRFLTKQPFKASQPVPVSFSIRDDGVGFDLANNRSIRYFFSKKSNPDPNADFEVNKGVVPMITSSDFTLADGLAKRITIQGNLAAAPPEKGEYYLFFRIEDQVGNWRTSEGFKFEVIDAATEAAAMKPKKYELVINASLNGTTDWDSIQEAAIRVVIDPPARSGATAKRVDGKYIFYGLESGKTYEVQGIFDGIASRGLKGNTVNIKITNDSGESKIVKDLDIPTR